MQDNRRDFRHLYEGDSAVAGRCLPRPPSRGKPPIPVSGQRSAPSHTPSGPPSHGEGERGPALLEDLPRSTGFNYISLTVPGIRETAGGGGFKHIFEMK